MKKDDFLILAQIIQSKTPKDAKNIENILGELCLALFDVTGFFIEEIQNNITAGDYVDIESYTKYISQIVKTEAEFAEILSILKTE